ncbi:hypothetical protein SDD30_14170 [Moorella naiadis]|uniref:type II secretion system F family protein n=1 Tax=Moorella naiadis (nom. illeg.) TaxID=3093670 RepID=UPI003D9CB442
MLEAIGRGAADVVKTGILSGAGLGVLGFFLCYGFIGAWAALPALVLFAVGVFLTGLLVEKEFKKWQEKTLEGIPSLLNFIPAFREVEGVTPREALALSLPFTPRPLRDELKKALDRIARTGDVTGAFDELAGKVKHPLMDAICFRLATSWTTAAKGDIFADLSDQLAGLKEEMAARATAGKTAIFALVCVLGLVGAALEFGYPGVKLLLLRLSGVFGG